MKSICGKGRWYLAAIGFGLAVSLNLLSNAAFAQDNQDCTLLVPANPLSAQGLATPYQFSATNPANGACDEANKNQSSFVQGAIFNIQTGQITIYNPLVINAGTTPLVTPTPPTLPQFSIVAIWFGFNGNNLALKETQKGDLLINQCTTNLSQFAACNAPLFFAAAQNAIDFGQLVVPPLGTSTFDGLTCPTVRSFFHVDQDQSDNVTSQYLKQNGQFAQNTAANRNAFPASVSFANPSDNRLLDVFIDGAIGCKPWMVPNVADNGALVPALPLNELQAQNMQATPIALVPLGDPMTNNPPLSGNPSLINVNRYRRSVDQQIADDNDDANTTTYCTSLRAIHPQKIFLDRTALTNFRSVDPTVANTLFTFMAQRYVAAYQILNCQGLLGQPVNVSLTLTNGIVTDATFLNN